MRAAAFARGQRARPLVYGHRGTRKGAPENTLLAMQRALSQGADGIELDVRLCGSGEVVVVHDPDLRRVAGAGAVVAQTPLSELQRQDLGGGERVPLLDAAAELVLGEGALLNIELKRDVPDGPALVAAVVECLRARNPAQRERVILSSFGARLCAALRAALPDAAIAFLFEREQTAVPAGVDAVHPRHLLATRQAVADWRAAGLIVNAWTVDDPDTARALSQAGVDGIMTDDVPRVLGALG